MNNPKQILWTDQNSMPPKNYLWLKEDGTYVWVNNNWKKTETLEKIEDEECFKRPINPKQILWCDLNSVPPKNYLWHKKDGIYQYNGKQWIKRWSNNSEEQKEKDYFLEPFTIEALESGNIVWNIGSNSLQYSMDSGSTWETFSSPLAVNAGDKVQFKGTNSSGFSYEKTLTNTTIDINVEGNIMSILAGDDFENATSMIPSAFSRLFLNMTNLKSVENLVLPVTNLTGAYGCYSRMFAGCTSITKAPELPATSLFQNYSNVYSEMFDGCTNLSYVKCLITGTIFLNTTDNWLRGVAASGTFIKAADVDWSIGVNGIPTGWTVETAAE